MAVIDRYITSESVKPLALITVLVTFIFASFSMARYTNEAIAGTLGLDVVLTLVGLKSLIALEVLLPIALYLSIVIGIGKLHSSSEIVALEAAGVSQLRIYRSVMLLVIPFCLLMALLSLFARPWAYGHVYHTEAIAESEFRIEDLQAGRFHSSTAGERIIYAGNVDPEQYQLQNVFLYRDKGNYAEVIVAEQSETPPRRSTETDYMQFHNGVLYRLDKKDSNDRVFYFKRFGLEFARQEPEVGYKRKQASTRSLLGTDDPDQLAELQWRLSRPVTTLVLGLFAVSLSGFNPRGGVAGRLSLAIGVYVVFYNLMGLARTWIEQGLVGALPGLWWVHVFMLVILVVWLQRRNLLYRLKSS